MGHQNILTLVDYFETMNNCEFFFSPPPPTWLVPGGSGRGSLRYAAAVVAAAEANSIPRNGPSFGR
jgi:hypothetical protein